MKMWITSALLALLVLTALMGLLVMVCLFPKLVIVLGMLGVFCALTCMIYELMYI